jgi:uncharacterized protein (UPF0262 family)
MTTGPAAEEPSRLVAVELDADSITRSGSYIEHERATAIHDLIAENVFRPVGRPAGLYRLRLSIAENKLVFDVADRDRNPVIRHILSLTPLSRLVKDYFIICDSYYAAIRTANPAQIEAIDMGRRGVHNEGSTILRERLAGKIDVDFETARRLFTLVCALHWKG